MNQLIRLSVLGLLLNVLVVTSASATVTEWFTITRISAASGCENMLLIEGNFAATSCSISDKLILTNTTSCSSFDEPNQKNFEINKKLLISAFLAGKQVQGVWTNCQGSYASLLGVIVCVDGSSCGQ